MYKSNGHTAADQDEPKKSKPIIKVVLDAEGKLVSSYRFRPQKVKACIFSGKDYNDRMERIFLAVKKRKRLWVSIPEELIRLCGTLQAASVLSRLIYYAGQEATTLPREGKNLGGDWSVITRRRLARQCHLHRRTIDSVLARLERQGYITTYTYWPNGATNQRTYVRTNLDTIYLAARQKNGL